ncbi:ATP-binding protein [Brevibacillus sp. MER 51]|uniref:ATP-binding protein n=1 Tax=Brevibacillus sp. MER 51 TaxID=2939560 RepID=UPI00203BF70B|nr:ATP-binding protein [Brevibacillus sp. MER 51]
MIFQGCYLQPCPCGFFGTREKQTCPCSPQQIYKYRSKLSGPLLDRIDLTSRCRKYPFNFFTTEKQRSPQKTFSSE